jgi:hypothetical protein
LLLMRVVTIKSSFMVVFSFSNSYLAQTVHV